MSFADGQVLWLKLEAGIWWPGYATRIEGSLFGTFWDEEDEVA